MSVKACRSACCFYLGRVPQAADHFEWDGLRFEIMDMDGRRIDKVLVRRAGDKLDLNARENDIQHEH